LLLINGVVETKDNVIHVVAGGLYDYSHELESLLVKSRDFR
jgi:error-prone DNA polymerase